MKQIYDPIRLVLAALAIVGFVGPAVAQAQTDKNLVPWRGTASATATTFMIPTEPPVLIVHYTGTGEENVLGSFSTAGYYVLRLGADGNPVSLTDVIWVQTAENGDALYGTASGIVRPSDRPGVLVIEGASLITGGKGRLAGATGHDTWRAEIELETGKNSLTYEGLVSRPKP